MWPRQRTVSCSPKYCVFCQQWKTARIHTIKMSYRVRVGLLHPCDELTFTTSDVNDSECKKGRTVEEHLANERVVHNGPSPECGVNTLSNAESPASTGRCRSARGPWQGEAHRGGARSPQLAHPRRSWTSRLVVRVSKGQTRLFSDRFGRG